MGKIRLSAVSYLNTKPFLYGIQNSQELLQHISELKTDIPSVCATKLMSGEADLGLIPVAVIPELPSPFIVSDYCIGAEGPVHTVMLYSRKPLNEVKKIYLDYQSKTSVKLVQVLAKDWWKISPEFIPAKIGFENTFEEAAVVIGDRTFELNGKFPFEYDLSEEWKKMTGLPFVFACWVSNKPLEEEFTIIFNKALKTGISAIEEVARINATKGIDLKEYFQKYISYDFTEEKKKALNLFWQLIKTLP
jgi:chorismate dehydratase